MAASDIPAALGLLSRLPIEVNFEAARARASKAPWAYPVAGALLAVIAAATAQLSLFAGLPSPMAAALALATLIVVTGAMHEDGLADCADGLWGGWDVARRLEIMKDSHIGVYGVLALVLGVLLRWQALAQVIEAGLLWPALLAVAMTSRAAMVPVMARLPHARQTGLSHSVGRPSGATAAAAVGVAALSNVALLGVAGIALLAVAALTTAACAAIAKAKIGGQTGDILGGTQNLTEIALLLTLAALTA